jgi:hypothetical protein
VTTLSPEERAPRIAGAIYGTILVLAVIAALSEDDETSTGAIMLAVLATSLVFWLAHVYADVLAERAAGVTGTIRQLVRSAARREWPLIEAALAPCAPLLLGVAGVFSHNTAVTLALIVGLVDLFAWGYTGGRAWHESRLAALLSALVAVALGTVMVLLKGQLH